MSDLIVTPVQRTIQEEGVAVTSPFVSLPNCLLTIGNTQHLLAELVMFIDPARAFIFTEFLRDLSQQMQIKRWTPMLLKPRRLNGIVYTVLSCDRHYTQQFCASVVQHYHRQPIGLLQVVTQDQNRRFPYELDYDANYLDQPLLKTH